MTDDYGQALSIRTLRRPQAQGNNIDVDHDIHSVTSRDEDTDTIRGPSFLSHGMMDLNSGRGGGGTTFDTLSSVNGVVQARFNWQSQLEASAGNKFVTSQESEILLKQFERPPDERRQRSFRAGFPMPEERAIEGAPLLHIGLTLLKGADKPQVNRSEQQSMIKTNEPHQKDALWRFNTAKTLLTDFDVGQDLSFVETDRTGDIAARARGRRLQLLNNSNTSRTKASRVTTRKGTADGHDVVTIDSSAVRIVNDLRVQDWDIQSTLIEVDETSLIHLILDFRHLVSRGGPDMTFAETKEVLEKMIEDARRLCVRSPILFRMSTRQHIINSQNTRYGIDLDDKFKTLTTSKGIREVISLGASYFNSLDPSNSSDHTQHMIRPKFLQMVVLLLMLLNDDDLAKIRDFLESTYKLKATRSHLEMVFLKVIPLMSINPRVFMEALISTVDSKNPSDPGINIPNERLDVTLSCWWDVFTKLRLNEGYFIPCRLDDLGRSVRSWSPKWPDSDGRDGYKSSQVFDLLQYAKPDCKLRTINEISPIDLHPEASMEVVSVALTDGRTVTIHPSDMDNITLLCPGKYAVTEAGGIGIGRTYDLLINERVINEEIKQSLMEVNALIFHFNKLLESPRSNSLFKMFNSNKNQLPYLEPLRPAGEITQSVAMGGVSDSLLASVYKIRSRKISRFDVISIIARDIQRIHTAVQVIDRRSSEVIGSTFTQERKKLTQKLETIQTWLTQADVTRKRVMDAKEISDDPIARIIYPSSWNPREKRPWFDYQAKFTEHDQLMTVEGKASFVTDVSWPSATVAEVSLHQHPGPYVVKPVCEVAESDQADQVRIGDLAVLAGHYMLIGTLASGMRDPRDEYIMENCLQIVGVKAENQSKRGVNRAEGRGDSVRVHFR